MSSQAHSTLSLIDVLSLSDSLELACAAKQSDAAVSGEGSARESSEQRFVQTLLMLQRWHESGGGEQPILATICSRLISLMRSRRRDIRPVLAMAWLYLALAELPRAQRYLERAERLAPRHPLLAGFQQRYSVLLQAAGPPEDTVPSLLALRRQTQEVLAAELPVPDGRARSLSLLRYEIERVVSLRAQLEAILNKLQLQDADALLAPLLRQQERLQVLFDQGRRLQELEAGLNRECAGAYGLLHELRAAGADFGSGQQGFSRLLELEAGLIAQLETSAAEGLDVRRLWQIAGDLAEAIDSCRQALSTLSRKG